jgi:hypothetical protein
MSKTLEQMVDEVREGLQSALQVRGKSLEVQVRRAGRRLPRSIRSDAAYLAQSVGLAQNPKLAKMIDMSRVQRAHAAVLAHLETIDLASERKTAALNMIASIAFALLVTGVLVLFVLVQRGFVS